MEFNIGPFALRTRFDPVTGEPDHCDLYQGDGIPKELTLSQGKELEVLLEEIIKYYSSAKIGQDKVLM